MAAARPSPDPQRSAPEAQGSPDPSQDSPPDRPSSAGQGDASSSPSHKYPDKEEPELRLEPDIPSDGRDEVGEAMIRKLPQRPEPSQPPGPGDDSSPP